ncbi:hypothetical protein COHA_005527 [Chlorella ohadii]|uniref:Anaphase-promoting complex subunit 2 n=1 Tax=Chlorella ohadii TaxID=2649997 RepID=A0AAD5H1Q2_9CHLO|nr:hypothetical protein COHA_005527 [Chlorella ohadii]
MAAAAAAWLSFADASGAALAAAGGSAAMARLPGDLAGAVDGITVHGLAPLVPAQLLSAAVAALRERVARLQAALGPVSATLEAAAAAEAGVDEEDGEQAAALPAELEDALAEALREACEGVEAATQLLSLLCERVLRSQPALGAADRAALLAAGPRFRREAAAALVAAQPCGHSWAALLYRYYWLKLRQLSEAAASEQGEDEAMADDGQLGGGGCLPEPGWGARLQDVAAYLRMLGLEAVSEEAFAAVVCRHLREHLEERTHRAFDERILGPALRYSASTPLAFLRLVLPQGADGAAALAAWRARLSYYVYEAVGGLRIADMFDIVVDWPDSLPAVEDIRDCLQNTSLHRRFVAAFRKSLTDRLLRPGAATADIIAQYVSTIKALAACDPSGAILGAVSGPIRAYLRGRRDTIRCIVTSLTADEEDAAAQSLLAELDNTEAAAEDYDSDFEGGEADGLALKEAERWEPDPVDADPSRAASAAAAGDVISRLVGIYGSKELFINEYRSMLADRLLSKGDYECDRELRTLELLKVRFGEGNLHNAEVMLKDLADSKRINTNVQSVPNTATPLRRRRHLVDIGAMQATIVSHLFWPQLQSEEFNLPPEVSAMLSTYAAKYRSLKAPRKLQWRPSLGTVSLDLTIGDQTLEFNVSPFHASVLMHFQTRPEWPAAELAERMGVAPDALRRKIVFWINQGVLSESRVAGQQLVYRRNEQLQTWPAVAPEQEGMELEGGAADEHAEMAAYEPFIMGMLTNFDALPLDRVHNMLKMFASDPPYDKSLEQLGAYMSRLVADEKLSGRLLGRQVGGQGPLRCLAAKAAGTPMVMQATVDAYGEGVTTLVSKEQFRFLVDEPVKLGGKGLAGPNPLSLLLGSLVGCTQYTCSMIAKEMKLGGLGAVAWSAAGEYDLRGVRGEPGVDARFRRIQVQGIFDGPLSQGDLDRMAEQIDRRCIVASTLKASGLDLQLSLQKGEVDHECEPACALHDLEAQSGGGVTGQAKGGSRKEADAPQFAGTGGQGRASARAFCTLARRGLHTAVPAWAKDGEDVAREHMGAHAAPQLQKETSEGAGAATTAGGAYASRDDPESQAAQPTQGKSDEQIVQEQGAGSTVHPQSAGNAEGGAPMDQGAAPSPGFADRAIKAGKEGRSPLGDQPGGDE